MKLICCRECGDVVGLNRAWRNCDCAQSGGGYLPDGDRVIVAGPCFVLGMQNSIRNGFVKRADVYRYDEGNGKVQRKTVNHGEWPERTIV